MAQKTFTVAKQLSRNRSGSESTTFTVNIPANAIIKSVTTKCEVTCLGATSINGVSVDSPISYSFGTVRNGNPEVYTTTSSSWYKPGQTEYTFQFTRGDKASTSVATSHNIVAVLTVTIVYSEYTNCIAPSSIGVSATSIAPKSVVKLSWGGASGGTNNNISSYLIQYSSNKDSGFTQAQIISTAATSGEWIISQDFLPQTNGTSYYYRIITRGEAGSAYYSGASSVVTVKCEYGIPQPPQISLKTSVCETAEKSALILGKSFDNEYSLTISISPQSAPLNNPICGYEIQYGNYVQTVTDKELTINNMDTILQKEAELAEWTCVVRALGTVEGTQSGLSNTVKISLLAEPESIASIIGTPDVSNDITDVSNDGKAYDNIIMSWSALENETEGNYQHIILDEEIIDTSNIKPIISTENNKATISLVEDLQLAENSNKVLYFYRKKYATHGGFTLSQLSTYTVTRTSAIPDLNIWSSYFDGLSDYCVKQYTENGVYYNSSYYDKLTMYLNLESNYTYILQYCSSNDEKTFYAINTFSALSSPNYEYDFIPSVNIPDFYLQMIVKDKYGASQIFSPINKAITPASERVIFTKVIPLVIEDTIIDSISPTDYTVSYKIKQSGQVQIADDGLQGALEFWYAGSLVYTTENKEDNSLPNWSDFYKAPDGFQFLKKPDSNVDVNTLYYAVNNLHYSKPSGNLIHKVWPKEFPNCVTSKNIPFNYNFERELTIIDANSVQLNGSSQKINYINGGSTVEYKINVSEFTFTENDQKWANELTSNPSISAEILYTQGSQTILVEDEYQLNSSIYYKIPDAFLDTSGTFSLNAIIDYGDGPVSVSMAKYTIPVAKWKSEIVVVNQQDYKGDFLNGSLKLPEYFCGSSQHKNGAFSAVKIFITSKNSTSEINVIQRPNQNENEEGYILDGSNLFILQKLNLSEGQHEISYIVTFTNTAGNSISVNTAPTLVRVGEIDFSVRRGRVGINVNSDFAPVGETATSTLYVKGRQNGNNDEAVVDIVTTSIDNENINGPSIQFTENDNLIGKIYRYREVDQNQQYTGRVFLTIVGTKNGAEDEALLRVIGQLHADHIEAEKVIGAVYQ